jgi:hypothetical protein
MKPELSIILLKVSHLNESCTKAYACKHPQIHIPKDIHNPSKTPPTYIQLHALHKCTYQKIHMKNHTHTPTYNYMHIHVHTCKHIHTCTHTHMHAQTSQLISQRSMTEQVSRIGNKKAGFSIDFRTYGMKTQPIIKKIKTYHQ